ncbi:uncharacterized protein LOC128889543 [Hylaeus anthracinus]|uniref:uncharacterized protein LOC128889543 n=1 Tax=Hylaeus anthracinus TaxID=313031 RepID=UPI0023B9F220|nr:uncharacterized protein LOC128889543 [Hylaeus anthracinus]
MSQAYIHACERAELLGLPIPTEEEWKETECAEGEIRLDEDDDELIQNLDSSNEASQRISGGLDELNSILNATQKKINRFKTVCGSLGTLLKVKVGSRTDISSDEKITERNHNETTNIHDEATTSEKESTEELLDDRKTLDNVKPVPSTPKKVDINEKMGSHLDKLDSLITKAENAQYSMQHQTKQMKKILK